MVGCSVAGQQTKMIDFQDVSKIRKMVLRGCKMEKTEKRSQDCIPCAFALHALASLVSFGQRLTGQRGHFMGQLEPCHQRQNNSTVSSLYTTHSILSGLY